MESLKPKTSLTKAELVDKIKGVIYGTAIGDGVGLATEFMGKQQAEILYGNGPIKFGRSKGHEFWRDSHRGRWHESDFTDDTDQMLVLAQSLLADGGTLNPINFAYRIDEWRRVGFPELDNKLANGIGYTVGSTFSHENFLSDPFRASYDVWNANDRNLAANGAVMRTSAVAIPSFWNEDKVVENCMLAAKVTHADPRSVVSAVIISVLISRLLRGSVVEEAESNPKSESQSPFKEHLLEVIAYGSNGDKSYLEKFKGESLPLPKQIHIPFHRSALHQVRRFAATVTGQPLDPRYDYDLSAFNIPDHPMVDPSRFHNPAQIRPNVKKMDELGSDPEMVSLCETVLAKYKFLLESHSLCPPPPPREEVEEENSSKKVADSSTPAPVAALPGGLLEKANLAIRGNWVDQLYTHSFPPSLAALDLNEHKKIGYTFKCLGAGLYTATRRKPEDMSSSHFYEQLITELTLETGDADTNCAVAGALLGARLGKSGLPKGWVDGLRHKEFLEKISNQLCELVLQSIIK